MFRIWQIQHEHLLQSKIKKLSNFQLNICTKNTPQDIAKDIKNYQSDEISPNLAALVNMGKF